MTRRTIARLVTVMVTLSVSFAAFADDEPCSRNHYILWSGPDHSGAKCIPLVDDGGSPEASPQLRTAVEYYQLDNERYFVTASSTEIAALDAKLYAGWMRSGQRYCVLDAPLGVACPFAACSWRRGRADGSRICTRERPPNALNTVDRRSHTRKVSCSMRPHRMPTIGVPTISRRSGG